MKKITLSLCLFALATAVLFAQKINTDHLKGIGIRNIGPAGMSGRVTAVDVVLSNPDVIYAGTASGGVWRSESGGIAWTPIFDKEAMQSVGAIAINQRNPSEIWVGAGEGNPRNSQNSGNGIYKSLDGGKTWKNMGLQGAKTIHRIIIHRDNPNTVFVAATGSAWGPSADRGVYRTTDGGKTWSKVLYVNDQTGCADMVVDPSNPNKIIAAMWEYGRKPWTFKSGGPGSGLYVSFDGGDSWQRRTEADGLPKGELGRIGLAIAASKPNIVYALVEAKENALYKSTDGGAKWQKVADKNIGDRPFYYAEIYVDPSNENRLYNIYSLVSKSEDGGKTFEVILPYSGVHPDHHAFWISPDDPEYLIEGNDGGLNISRDGGKNWRFVENLPLAQFYHIDYDMDIPYNVAGGMQDNGSWVGPSAVWKEGGILNSDWQEVYFGDGFDVSFRPDNNRYVYAMSQGGNLGYIDRITGDSKFIKPTHPDGIELRFNWNAAFAQNPFNPRGIYYGSQFVHKSNDNGQSWELISPDLTTNDTTKQQQQNSGGLTPDVTSAENHTTILAIAPSPLDANVIWVGTDDGNLQLTRDGGKSWNNLASRLPGANPGSWIPYIEVSKKNAAEAFVIVNDYRRNDWRPMAYYTADYGATFKRIADENKVDGHALCIVQDPLEPNLLWLGTDYGLYFSIDKGDTWNKWTNGYPSVSTIDLKIHPREHDLIVGTFGRAAWILDDVRPIREIARSKGKVLDKPFSAFASPDAYLANYRSFDGYHFPADAVFQGENRRNGAMFTLWVKPMPPAAKDAASPAPAEKDKAKSKAKTDKPAAEPTKKDDGKGDKKEGKDKKQPEKVKINVFDNLGDTIRTYSVKLDTGMNRVYWYLDRNGVRFPSRREQKPDDDPPGGMPILPGVYKVLFAFGDHKDSTMVTVHPDPRIQIPLGELQARDAAYRDFYAIVNKASKSFTQLQDARKTIQRVDNALTNAPDSTKQQIAKLGKTMQDSLDTLEKLFTTPENQKGIQRFGDNFNYYIFQTMGYLRSLDGPPNQPVQRMMTQLRSYAGKTFDRINAFFSKDFAGYRQKVEAVPFSLFKPIDPVSLE